MPNLEILPPPTKETIEAVRAAYGVDEVTIKDSVRILREWLKLQPHLPHVMDDRRLETLFLRSKCSIERAKRTLDLYYTVRTAIPEFLSDRDPMKPWFKETADLSYFLAMPTLTDDCCRVLMGRTVDMDVSKYDVPCIVKMMSMMLDIRYIEDYWVSEIVIIDTKGAEMGHVAKFTPPIMKKIQLCALQAFRCRIKAIHVLNAHPVVVSLVNVAKTMLKPKLAERFHIHKPGYESLHEFISPKVLPLEYGGEAGPIMDIWAAWRKKIEFYREWFLEEEKYKADESKRPEKSINTSDLFGFEGTFRQLSVD